MKKKNGKREDKNLNAICVAMRLISSACDLCLRQFLKGAAKGLLFKQWWNKSPFRGLQCHCNHRYHIREWDYSWNTGDQLFNLLYVGWCHLFSVNSSAWWSILCAGNSCTTCEREDVQGTLHLLCRRDRHFLQRCNLGLLVIWKSSCRQHCSEQLLDRPEAPCSEMVSTDDKCVLFPSSFSCGRGTCTASKWNSSMNVVTLHDHHVITLYNLIDHKKGPN